MTCRRVAERVGPFRESARSGAVTPRRSEARVGDPSHEASAKAGPSGMIRREFLNSGHDISEVARSFTPLRSRWRFLAPTGASPSRSCVRLCGDANEERCAVAGENTKAVSVLTVPNRTRLQKPHHADFRGCPGRDLRVRNLKV